ncbi:MAG: isocitrate/isopropylmalate family dehydrogenase [Gammaproteobacteria bacterium]
MTKAPDHPDLNTKTANFKIALPFNERLTFSISGWEQPPCLQSPFLIGILKGEGVGPEVINASLPLLKTIEDETGLRFDLRYGGAIGLDSKLQSGQYLTDEVENFCQEIFTEHGAIFCGPGGGRFVYQLRERFDLFCKLVPLQPLIALRDTGPLRPEKVSGVDILIVRENLGGLYQGEFGFDNTVKGRRAYHFFHYEEEQIVRILKVASQLAKLRRGRLCVINKPGGAPSISQLWSEHGQMLATQYGVDFTILEVDNAIYQLIANPEKFDVVAAPNLFGDVLADGAAALLASRGLSYSANFSSSGASVYQTGHGAAFDLAGKDLANPLGQMQSLSFLLREKFGLTEIAMRIRTAIESTLAAGWRTQDIASSNSRVIGTEELGLRIADTLRENLAAHPL